MELNANKEAVLLRLNKERQVQALNEIGFTEVTMDTPLSEIAEYIKWAGGLRDIRLAAMKSSDNSITYFTAEEWGALSANAKSNYQKLGACVRARCLEWIVAPRDCADANGTETFKFGGYGLDFKGVANFGGNNSGLYEHIDGLADTEAIITQTAGYTDSQNIKGAPAAEAAYYFKAFDGDPLQWHLPAIPILRYICEYVTEINAFFDKVFGGQGKINTSTWYWSSTEYDSAHSWGVYMNHGISYINIRTISHRVRPVAVVAK